jgi:hypothetical protein
MNDVSKQYHGAFQYKDGLEVRSPVVHTCGLHVYVASCFFFLPRRLPGFILFLPAFVEEYRTILVLTFSRQ